MNEIEIFPLFACNVFLSTISEDLSILQKAKDQDFHQSTFGNGNFASNNLKVLENFPSVKEIIKRHFNDIRDNVLKYNDTEFEFTTSWITKFIQGSSCQFHGHLNSLYSGILYFDEYDDDCGHLEFDSPFITNQIYVKPNEYNIVNSNSYKFKPKKNLLITFPSFLRHRVCTHFSKNDRYSLAFNLIPVGNIGSNDSRVNIDLNQIF